ncbi:MAG: hypothetical protein KAX53_08115, partial [Saprospiraceae bacterium]|nr:hypothetical protein [Saprospiraceae bacterium]
FKIKAAIFCKNPKYNLYCNHILTDGWRNWRSARILYKRFLDRQLQRLMSVAELCVLSKNITQAIANYIYYTKLINILRV